MAGMVAHVCNSSTVAGEAGGLWEGKGGQSAGAKGEGQGKRRETAKVVEIVIPRNGKQIWGPYGMLLLFTSCAIFVDSKI